MNSKSIALILGVLSVMTIATTAVLAKADHPNFGQFVNSHQVEKGSKLILNINYKVTNDEDSGMQGYWALDNYNKHVQVWQLPNDTFYAVVRYEGKWQTFAGALSPQNGVAETKDASGTFHGGYVATFTGTFTPGTKKTHGNVGTYDFGGTKADILLGTYGNGQVGVTPPFDWLSSYFTGSSNFVQTHWGWTYHYRSQAWNNFLTGNSGDIVV